MSDFNSPIEAPMISDLETLRRFLEAPSLFKESWPNDTAASIKYKTRWLTNQQLSIVLGYLAGKVDSESIAPLRALLEELLNLDHGEAGPITSPVGKQEMRLVEPWTKALVTAIVEHAMGEGSKMASVLDRIRIETGIAIKEKDVRNWRDQRDQIMSARRLNEGANCHIRAFNYFEYEKTKKALESKTRSEADYLSMLRVAGKSPARRAKRGIDKT